VGSAGWAVYLCFTLDRVFGLVMTILTAVGLAVFTVATVKILPRTFLGRRLHLGRDALAPGEGTPEAQMLAHLVGRTTVTETVLRPSGAVRIDGKRIVAQSESGMIERGVKVKIIGAAGSHVVVRKTDE
jgi:membrane-bound ClpP family serine protease